MGPPTLKFHSGNWDGKPEDFVKAGAVMNGNWTEAHRPIAVAVVGEVMSIDKKKHQLPQTTAASPVSEFERRERELRLLQAQAEQAKTHLDAQCSPQEFREAPKGHSLMASSPCPEGHTCCPACGILRGRRAFTECVSWCDAELVKIDKALPKAQAVRLLTRGVSFLSAARMPFSQCRGAFSLAFESSIPTCRGRAATRRGRRGALWLRPRRRRRQLLAAWLRGTSTLLERGASSSCRQRRRSRLRAWCSLPQRELASRSPRGRFVGASGARSTA